MEFHLSDGFEPDESSDESDDNLQAEVVDDSEPMVISQKGRTKRKGIDGARLPIKNSGKWKEKSVAPVAGKGKRDGVGRETAK